MSERPRVRTALAAAAARLSVHSDTARLDAELLMAHALGVSREAMLLGQLDVAAADGFEALVARRAGGEPIAYITGTRAFWTIELAVTPAVLIPRPDSETLIEQAVRAFADRSPMRVLDLGTGSGALLLATLDQWRTATGLGVDRSPAALAVAEGNARRLGLADRAAFCEGDWGTELSERFDLILCNPPYIEAGAVLPRDVAAHEPASALYAGPDGLDDYRRILPQLKGLLAPDGVALVEIGSAQAAAVAGLAGGYDVDVARDMAALPRCIIIRLARPG